MKRKYNEIYLKSFDIDHLNDELPLNLKEIEPIINKVMEKYPSLSKFEITIIIKYFLEEIRKQLIKGVQINIRDLLMRMRLYTFCKLRNNKLYFSARVQVTTPTHMKKF